ncbi:hypothetical protein PAHAL_8G014400 [Panicum hallii]|uniref:Uncharacterized protein n=1 Tax=Panicum hallii TaxID=206008 RepID=A0A2T8I748_9POAL|nr:hypothetical protein PAHAL_8G014400 [Panicum hallii]
MEAAVVSGILKVLGSKLAPLLIKEYSLIVGVQKHLEELNDQVQEINCWLEAVGDEVARNGPALNWLTKLKDIAYGVDDIIDEFQLEAERHDAHGIGGVVSNYLYAKPKSLILQRKAASKLTAVKKIFDGTVKQRTEFSTIANSLLASHPARDMNHNTANMTSLPTVDVASVLGRDQEKHQIISELVETNDQQRIKTVSIIGLAIKALAGVLRGKGLIGEWQAMRDSNLLHFMGEERGVSVSACLRMSYFHLSSHLKQCFTICSLLPKGHKIDKEQLIDLWIAHDMITFESGVDYLDYIGHKCFNSLVKMSFLQDAQYPPPKNLFQKARSIYVDNCDDAIFGALKNARHLRSITMGPIHMEAIPIAILQHLDLSLSNEQLLQSPRECNGSSSFSGFSHLKKLLPRDITGCGRGWELLQHMTALQSRAVSNGAL